MERATMALRLAVVTLVVGLASGALGSGCSKNDEGGAPGGVNEDGGGVAPSGYELPSDDFLRYAYDVTPPAVMTLYDVIRRDRVLGTISAEDALEQELCLYYGDPCLRAEYASRTDVVPLPDASDIDRQLEAEYGALDDAAKARVIDAWAALIGEPASGQGPLSSRLTANPTVREATVFGDLEIDLPNGNCVVVPRNHSHIKALRNVDTVLEFDVPGAPYHFQVFYKASETAAEVAMLVKAFRDQTFVQDMNRSISSTWPTPYDAGVRSAFLKDPVDPGQMKVCNDGRAYRIFAVATNGPSVAVTKPGGTTAYAGPSSISFNVNQVRDSYYRTFLRAGGETLPNGQNFANGLVIHEWTHALQFMTRRSEACGEAFADAASQAYARESGEPYMMLAGQLYNPTLTLCSRGSLTKQYGSSLFFMLLNDKYGTAGLKTYFDRVSSGATPFEALSDVTRGDGLAKVFHAFAESSLDLDYPQVLRFAQNPRFPQVRDYYLSNGALATGAVMLTDSRTTVRFQALHGLGIQYVAFLAGQDTLDNYFRFDVKKWNGGFSVFGIKVDEDASKYRVVYHGGPYEKGTGNVLEAKFAEPDREPELFILVFSNPGDPERDGWGHLEDAEVQIEARPFSTPFPVSVTYETNTAAGPDPDPDHTTKASLGVDVTVDPEWHGDWATYGGIDLPLPGTYGQLSFEVPKILPFAMTTEFCGGANGSTRSDVPPTLVGHWDETQFTTCRRLDGTYAKAKTTWKAELRLDLGSIDPAARSVLQFIQWNEDQPGTGKAAIGWCFGGVDGITTLRERLERAPATCTTDVGSCCAGRPDPFACEAELDACPTAGTATVDFDSLFTQLGIPDGFHFAPGTRLQGTVTDPDDPTHSTVVDIGPLPEAMEGWRSFPPRRILYIPDAPLPGLEGQFIPKVIDIGGKNLAQ